MSELGILHVYTHVVWCSVFHVTISHSLYLCALLVISMDYLAFPVRRDTAAWASEKRADSEAWR